MLTNLVLAIILLYILSLYNLMLHVNYLNKSGMKKPTYIKWKKKKSKVVAVESKGHTHL